MWENEHLDHLYYSDPDEYEEIDGLISGADAFQTAKRKSRYGHRHWIAWVEDDTRYAAPKSREAISAAMAAVGENGFFYSYVASQDVAQLIDFDIANIMLRNLKYGV